MTNVRSLVHNLHSFLGDAAEPLSAVEWPYCLLQRNESNIYLFKQSDNLARDLTENAKQMLKLVATQSGNTYYQIEAESMDDALLKYVELVPQISVKVVEHDPNHLNVKLGYHQSSSPSNSIRYQ